MHWGGITEVVPWVQSTSTATHGWEESSPWVALHRTDST